MGQLRIDGQLQAGPLVLGQDRSTMTTALALKGGIAAKPYAKATGIIENTVATGGVYQALPGVGADPAITKANTLYFFSDSPVLLRLTTDDGAGGSVVAVVPVDGLFVSEFQDSKFLKLVEVNGSGGIEYFVSGNQ